MDFLKRVLEGMFVNGITLILTFVVALPLAYITYFAIKNNSILLGIGAFVYIIIVGGILDATRNR